MSDVESVIYLSKDFMADYDCEWVMLESLEVYKYGKAYGGRPMLRWERPVEDKKEWFEEWWLVTWAPGPFSKKSVIKKSFLVLSNCCGCDLSKVRKLTAYKHHSEFEVERLFIWERGDLFENESWKW